MGQDHQTTRYQSGLAVLSALCGLLALTLTAAAFGQQAYPNKSVRVVVPFAPGGGADTLARILFGELTVDFGQQFIIDNRGGGSGTIGASLVAKATPDGYAILHDATGIDRLASLSVQTRANTPAEFGAFIAAEMEKWGKVVRTANIKAE